MATLIIEYKTKTSRLQKDDPTPFDQIQLMEAFIEDVVEHLTSQYGKQNEGYPPVAVQENAAKGRTVLFPDSGITLQALTTHTSKSIYPLEKTIEEAEASSDAEDRAKFRHDNLKIIDSYFTKIKIKGLNYLSLPWSKKHSKNNVNATEQVKSNLTDYISNVPFQNRDVTYAKTNITLVYVPWMDHKSYSVKSTHS
ncbi:MAG: hypothetical protein ACP5N2_05440 [Candidatus Nanoarchaeia archaeon]